MQKIHQKTSGLQIRFVINTLHLVCVREWQETCSSILKDNRDLKK